MELKDLKKFLEDSPAISPDAFGMEVGFSSGYLGKILRGDKPFSEKAKKKIAPFMKKYGFGK